MGNHRSASLPGLTFGWLLMLLPLVTAPVAMAYPQWEWKYGGITYPTKEQALAAMRAAAPQNASLTKELPPVQMGFSTVRYNYVAPPEPVTYGTMQFNAYCNGWSFSCTYPSEAAAAAALANGTWYVQCGPGSAAPTSDWLLTQQPPALTYFRHYQAQASGYSETLGCIGTNTLNTGITSVQNLTCPANYSVTLTPPYICQNGASDYITGHPLECACNLPVPGTSTEVSNPIDVATADKKQTETDYSGPALSFIRYYHSQALESFHGLGAGWTHSFSAYLIVPSNTPEGLVRPDGSHDPLTQIGAGYISESGASIHVQASGSNWTAYLGDGSQEVYDSSGYLIQLINSAGQVTTVTHNIDGTVASVVDPFGHALQMTYTNGLLSQLTDPSGHVLTYTYDSNNNLTSVTYPDGSVRSYAYEVPSLVNHLTGVTDEAGIRYATFGYDSIGRASSSQHVGGADAVSVSYGTGTATVVDSLGGTTVFTFGNLSNYSPRLTSVSHNGITRNYVVPSAYLTDIQQRDTQMTDEDGNVSTYSYDNDHLTSTTQASGTSAARTYSYSYLSPLTALPTVVNEPLKKTTYGYYSGTNLVQTKTITDPATGLSRSWNYTYDSYGRLLTADGPRTDVSDVTTYSYYTCTTGYQCGQLQTITNAVGQVTTFNTYNAHGQPLTITDPNGVLTTLAYDLRQRLISRQVGSETTAFSYWPTGLLKQVTLPDGSYLLYTYDGAHRLIQISDSLGNKIVYTLDAMGNRTAENTYDPSGTLHRTHTRVFNTLNELYQEINAAGTAAVTTTFGYDSDGNQTSVAAPLSRNTTTTYDPLNRVKQTIDPANGVTKFTYDSNDNLASVTDPRNLVTSYTYNGFGDLLTLTSPDTGGASNTYDSAGNLATATDARGAVSTYSYDALNRVTSVAYTLGGTTDQTISFAYDSGTNGAGHLTGASDAHHSLNWTYDTVGRVVSKSQTVNGVTKTVNYAFTSGDLTTLTTPSGQALTYGYNTNHQVTSVAVNGTTILSNVTYEPLGPVSGWTWGNATTTTRSFTGDGVISQILSNGARAYSYDDALRVTAITDTSTGSSNWTYGYDLLDRLTSGANGTITRGWTYDANGNRLTETGSSASTYSIATSSNRITGITGALARTYGYDAAGHTTSYSSMTASYNNAGRLGSVSNGSTNETLIYNAVGQRIQTSGGAAGTVLYWYDEEGHLLGEYDASGNLIEETVWLGDVPVATLQSSGSGVAVYYVHTDQLNTPRQITRPADNAQMWTWFSDPFGTDAANSNPGGAGAFAYNLRFPGQVFDGQVGLHSNGFRDFDPATGRYVESDPIGLKGGINTYLYSDANPISVFDRSGLDPTTLPLPPAENTTCCDTGQIAICMNNPRNKNYKCKVVQDAMVLHEMTHVNDFRRWAPSICAKFTGKQSVALGFTTYTEQIQSELRAFNAQRDALNRAKNSQCLSPECQKEVDEWLNYITNQAIPSVLNQTYGR